ncbi:MAG: VOC family protein [Actinomycetota bacterium]|nr:VOC family protein [Actinomycetota bacterium]
MPAIARLSLAALDCEDPFALSRFYSALTGWPVEEDDDNDEWVQLRSDGPVTLAFQRIEDYEPPVWPGSDAPQQLHLDFDVPDLDAGEQQVLALGAQKADYQPGETFRVFLDPAGHPFCLVLAG